jgi:hypothetical protein
MIFIECVKDLSAILFRSSTSLRESVAISLQLSDSLKKFRGSYRLNVLDLIFLFTHYASSFASSAASSATSSATGAAGSSIAGALRDYQLRNYRGDTQDVTNAYGFSSGEDGLMSPISIQDLYFTNTPVVSIRDGVKLKEGKTVDNKFDFINCFYLKFNQVLCD